MKVIGGLLMGCGILVALVSGLCTVLFLQASADYDTLTGAIVLGVLPLLFGIAMVWAGRLIIRNENREEARARPTTPEPPEES